jgi:hypothetical protein
MINTLFQSHAIEDGYDGYEMPCNAPQVIIIISRVTALVCGGSWNEGLRWSIGETNLACLECFCLSNTTLSSWSRNTSFQKPRAQQFFRFLFFKKPRTDYYLKNQTTTQQCIKPVECCYFKLLITFQSSFFWELEILESWVPVYWNSIEWISNNYTTSD